MAAHAICISRALGVSAEEISANVAAELGFRCVDEEILVAAAERRNLSPSTVAGEEQRKSLLAQFVHDIRRGGVGEVINYIPGQRALPVASDDVRVLIRDAIVETVKGGKVVVLAHAASYAIGSRKDVLRVLVTGSQAARVNRWCAKSAGKSPRDAAKIISDSDEARANYLKRFYDVDHESPQDYDLALSTDKLTVALVARLIVDTARTLDPADPEVSPPQTGWELPPTPRHPRWPAG